MRPTLAEGRRGLVARQAPGVALLETALVCALMLAGLALASDGLSTTMLQRGILNVAPIAALWGAIRLEPARGAIRRRLVIEALLAPTLVTLVWGLVFATSWLEATYHGVAVMVDAMTLISVYVVSGVVYAAGRCGVFIALLWGRLRRRRMVWSLTHTQLVVALLAVSPLVVLLLAYARWELSPAVDPGTAGLVPAVISTLVLSAPMLAILAVLVAGGVALLVPLLAIPSYVSARRMTRRLEALAHAARHLREGDLSARVEVRGEDEVAQLQRDFNAMAEDLQRTMADLAAERDRVAGLLEARRDLVAGVSHELRTPVAMLRAHLESALDGDAGAEGEGVSRDDLVRMHGEVTRLQALIDDLLALSRAEVGRLTLRCEPVDLHRLAAGVVDTMAPIAWKQHRVRLLLDGVAGVSVTADAARVQQVLVNLVHNALRHTPPGGMVMVRALSESARGVLEVCDTGEGILPDDLPHVWERYYRGALASDDDGGSGLGLALVKQLTEAMGGGAEVESTPGEGSRFRVVLPLS